jgi:hypothetical protein
VNYALPIYIAGMLVYIALAILAIRFIWRRTATPTWTMATRVLARSGAVAFLFSPTFYACGAAAPVPFPILLVAESFMDDGGCGRITSFLTWNVSYVVLPTLALVILVYLMTLWVARRGAR